MPTLAIAGGTSATLGRAIVTALLASPCYNPWNVVILSRSSRAPMWLRAVNNDTRIQIRTVNYQSAESIAAALQDIHTVVSVTACIDGSHASVQINLLKGAVQEGCKRFVPSFWGFGPKALENLEFIGAYVEGVREECVKHRDRIEYAIFSNGSIMNYFGHGIFTSPSKVDEETLFQQMKQGNGYATGEDAACSGFTRQGDLKDGSGGFLIGLQNGIAVLPVKDDGTWPRITTTTLRDIGRFVAASLDLPKWEREMDMVGETLTMGELLAHAEAVTGRKFKVEPMTQADFRRKMRDMAPDDFLGRGFAEMNIAYTRDLEGETILRPVVNQLCPDVKPMGVREYMETFWNQAG